MNQTIKAPKLKKGDCIGLITPAGPISKDQLESAISKFQNLGFRVKYYDSILERNGYLAGSDINRAKEINQMFLDKEVNAICCARGGFGTQKILEYLDYQAIKENPKIIFGYSDITALLWAIYKKTGLVCFHSTMAVPSETSYTTNQMLNILCQDTQNYKITLEDTSIIQSQYPEYQQRIYNPKKGITGKLIGGNLTLVDSLIGTEYFNNLNYSILFVEEINEVPYKLDRMLTHLYNSKALKNVKAIVFGIMKGCKDPDGDTLTQIDVIEAFAKKTQLPIMYGFSFGHVPSRCTFPLGIKARINFEKFEIKLLENCCQ